MTINDFPNFEFGLEGWGAGPPNVDSMATALLEFHLLVRLKMLKLPN